jgi:type II secretory pathway component PulL
VFPKIRKIENVNTYVDKYSNKSKAVKHTKGALAKNSRKTNKANKSMNGGGQTEEEKEL